MAIRLICGDGGEVALARIFLEKLTLFKDPALANARSYTLTCKASSASLSTLLNRIYDESENVEITDENFDELRRLAQELGFSGLDKEFREFEALHAGDTVKSKLATLEERVDGCDIGIEGVESEVVMLRRRVQEFEARVAVLEDLLRQQQKGDTGLRDKVEKHDRILVDFQRKLDQSSSRPQEALLQQVRSLENKVDEMSRSFEQRLSSSLSEFAKRDDVARSQPTTIPMRQDQLCTFATDGADFITQKWYHCVTCGLVGQLGCCEICARTCHKGHQVVLEGVFPGCFCDCGAGEGRVQCQCLGPLSGMRAISHLKDGIIYAMTQAFRGRNLHDQGQVTVTARDVYGSGYEPKYVLDLDDNDSCYESGSSPGPWFCLDFGSRRVTVSGYWVRTYGKGRGFLRSWALEGSADGTTWAPMDAVEDASDMKKSHARTVRKVTGAKGPFRYIRFVMTGTNHQGLWYLNCSGIELLGTLYERK